nr:MAG TPA: hypothetical protein [Caudoviricetes sp.]
MLILIDKHIQMYYYYIKGVINMKYIICIGGMIELSIIFGLLLFLFDFRNN